MRFCVTDLLEATDGRLVVGSVDAECDGVSFDSRALAAGSLFLPLQGFRDGHDFIEDALRAGAAGTLTARRGAVAAPEGRFVIRVADVACALDRIGRLARSRVPTVVAVTGSAGKTTTKDFLAHVLARLFCVGSAPGSFNNEIGVPVTLANAPQGARIVVVEIGARGAGDVAAAAMLACPDVAIVTNVGSAHIGEFGSRDAIAVAKAELLAALPAGGTAVLNADDPCVLAMGSQTEADVITFGFRSDADVRAEGLWFDSDLNAHFTLVTPDQAAAQCRLPAAAEHIVSCALAAAAAAWALGVSCEETAVGLGAATRSTHRMQLLDAPGGWRVLDDAYNANPEAMRAAIDATVHLAAGSGRAMAVIGHMAELGDYAVSAHVEIGDLARRLGFNAVVAVGAHAELLADVEAPDPASAAMALRECAGGFRPGDVILVKASRCVGLEAAVESLLADNPDVVLVLHTSEEVTQ